MSSHVVMAISICISASKQKSCYFRVQLCWLWISGYRPRESWLASVAASLVQWLWNEGTSRVSVQKAEQMQVNHLPPTAVGCTQKWAQNQHSPLTYWPPPLGGEGLMPSNRWCRRQILDSRTQRNQCHLWAAQFHSEQVYMESHHCPSNMGWGGSLRVGMAGYMAQHGIHPPQILRALLTSVICFFLSLSHGKISWGRKKLIGRLPSMAKIKIQGVTLFLQTDSNLQDNY